MVTTAERGREVRQRLLRAAAELIAERGWSAVSTRMLAERAGVAPGLVHYHFSSVQAVLVEAAVGAARDLAAQAGPALAAAQSAEEGVAALFGMLDAHTGTDPTSVLFVEAYLAATRDEALRAALGAVIGEFRRLLADLLDAHAVPDPAATALVLTAAVDGLLVHRALRPGPDGADVTAVLRRLLSARPEDRG
ncbi:TetR family transcriptional regulator [Virgisporangium aliadipatigenens]|uniref:TetR family transcriptional regulator n=1 Tax=Virgisporangium aliadipatigenens TaxID=741659 RepID=A0A8J3YJV2_9ACTN|nr:TetR/AcrR family transcriptional regulator [Virgisporangium aliadipatigenens]GIJ45188.1 TetR family transcriptional regulator [Virgisporangium aliadipatigenens]